MATSHGRRSRIQLSQCDIKNTHSTDFPGNYYDFDDAWNFKQFKKKFKIKVVDLKEDYVEFDMIGIDASIANAFRRIMLAEVPAIAIEKVMIHNNTSIIQDEVLAHRLGLIPIAIDPRRFEYFQNGDNPSATNCVKFKLQVKCTKNRSTSSDATDPEDLYIHSKVTTKDLKWDPITNQEAIFGANGVRPVHDDILIAKLRPGQEIDLELLCVKGIGSDHAKFSPVATASYRLMPEIILKKPITGELAENLAKCFPKGVIGIHESKGDKKAYVANSRLDTCSRQVLRDAELEEYVTLNKIRDHFIFSVESTGALSAAEIVREAITILKEKCHKFLNELDSNNDAGE